MTGRAVVCARVWHNNSIPNLGIIRLVILLDRIGQVALHNLSYSLHYFHTIADHTFWPPADCPFLCRCHAHTCTLAALPSHLRVLTACHITQDITDAICWGQQFDFPCLGLSGRLSCPILVIAPCQEIGNLAAVLVSDDVNKVPPTAEPHLHAH